MGTDIHMGAEVFDRESGRWANTGRVFESTSDWDYRPITRELLEMLDAPTLLRAFNFHVTHEKYSSDMAPHLSDPTLTVFKRWDAYRSTQQHALVIHRDRVSAEGWDYYGKVKPFEDEQMRAARKNFIGALDLEQLREVVEAALRYDASYREQFPEEDDGPYVRLERCPDDPPFMTGHPFQDRNYDVFAVLGNVRNGRGFAGVETGNAIKPISDCRGIPDDADAATLELLSNEHSATWVKLSELDAYDWDAAKINCGVVTAELYEVMKHVGRDDPWHPDVVAELEQRDPSFNRMDIGVRGWVSGGGVVVFDPPGYEHWIARGKPLVGHPSVNFMSREVPVDESQVATAAINAPTDAEISAHVQVRWTKTIREDMPASFWSMVEALHRLVPEGGTTDDVRIVMDFDS